MCSYFREGQGHGHIYTTAVFRERTGSILHTPEATVEKIDFGGSRTVIDRPLSLYIAETVASGAGWDCKTECQIHRAQQTAEVAHEENVL